MVDGTVQWWFLCTPLLLQKKKATKPLPPLVQDRGAFGIEIQRISVTRKGKIDGNFGNNRLCYFYTTYP
jgi:hypothetical protein